MNDPPLVSRDEAKRLGLNRFFTGQPCKRGHTTQRETGTGKCVGCERVRKRTLLKEKMSDPNFRAAESRRARAYNLAHPEQIKRNKRASRARHVERARARVREWQKANPERVKENLRRFHAENPGKQREYDKRRRNWPERLEGLAPYRDASKTNRRSRLAATGETVSQADLDAIRARAKGRCMNCGKRRRLQFDHIQPLARGGRHTPGNLQMLCRPCNLAKLARDPIEWAQSQGRLV